MTIGADMVFPTTRRLGTGCILRFTTIENLEKDLTYIIGTYGCTRR